jgi:hypothetical protein
MDWRLIESEDEEKVDTVWPAPILCNDPETPVARDNTVEINAITAMLKARKKVIGLEYIIYNLL